MQTVIEAVIAKTKPEAAYFHPEGGDRGATIVFDMKDSSEVAGIAEILFHGGDATVEFTPVMNADDLKKGLSSL